MTSPTLLILAAGMGSRYGGLKQMEPIGPSGETIIDYSIYDALHAGFNRIVFILREDIEDAFRTIVGARFDGRVATEYVLQDGHNLPAGFTLPEGRTKPWGTTHAVLAARNVIEAPFAVLNADDFYGAQSFHSLAAHFASGAPEYALSGYTLRNTLSPYGSVARGVCQVDANGFLQSITEHTAIEADGTGGALSKDAAGNPIHFTGEEVVSMNLWGLTPAVFPQLEQYFTSFLEQNAASLSAECYLPNAIGSLLATHSATVRVLPTADAWAGVTYRADHEHTVAHIAGLIRAGKYPANLWA